jgi:hypothetical protein
MNLKKKYPKNRNKTGDARKQALADMTPKERRFFKDSYLVLGLKDFEPEIVQIKN